MTYRDRDHYDAWLDSLAEQDFPDRGDEYFNRFIARGRESASASLASALGQGGAEETGAD